jgi:hypothetical protein
VSHREFLFGLSHVVIFAVSPKAVPICDSLFLISLLRIGGTHIYTHLVET